MALLRSALYPWAKSTLFKENKQISDKNENTVMAQTETNAGPAEIDPGEEVEDTIPQVRAKRNRMKPKYLKDYVLP